MSLNDLSRVLLANVFEMVKVYRVLDFAVILRIPHLTNSCKAELLPAVTSSKTSHWDEIMTSKKAPSLRSFRLKVFKVLRPFFTLL